jgi:hypothetical protein
MAKVNHNVVVEGLSGAIGRQLVFRRSKSGRTIVAYKPSFPEDRVFTPAQLAQQAAFREAVAYAHVAQTNPVYIAQAKDLFISPYNLAVADWFTPPTVVDLDLSLYTGQAGQPIQIKTLDDVQVKAVNVIITTETGTLIEQGPATSLDGLDWKYTSTTAAPVGAQLKVQAIAQDLPGHTGKLEKTK